MTKDKIFTYSPSDFAFTTNCHHCFYNKYVHKIENKGVFPAVFSLLDVEQKKYFEATCSAHPHNLYLTWLAETGIFGFLLFITFLISISIKIIKYKKIVFDDLIIFSILLSMIPKLIPMMPSLNFFSNWNAICFWLLIGWLLSFLPKESNKKKSIKNLSHF